MDEILANWPIHIVIHRHAISHICQKSDCHSNAEFSTGIADTPQLSVCGIHLRELVDYWTDQIVESKHG